VLACADLPAPLGQADERERWMIPRMHANRVPAFRHAPHHFRVAFGALAYHEESAPRSMPLEDIHEPRCEHRVWSIIEGQRGHRLFR
jgi:hypothetical protein